MADRKINTKALRRKAAAAGFVTLAELARHIGCSRPSIYFAIERPSRYPIVYRKLKEVLDV